MVTGDCQSLSPQKEERVPRPSYEGGLPTSHGSEPVILPPSFAILGEPIPTTYVVDFSSTNKLVKRRTSKLIHFLEGVGCCFASGGIPHGADRQLGQSKDHSICGWVGEGLLPRPTLLSRTPLGEGGDRNLGVSPSFPLGGKGGVPVSTPLQEGGGHHGSQAHDYRW